MLELGTVAFILVIVALASESDSVGWIGTLAVVLTFAHIQVSTRLAEAHTRPKRVVCHRWATRYLVAKEMAWALFFILTESWWALVGAAIFLLYPLWRRYWIEGRRPSESELY